MSRDSSGFRALILMVPGTHPPAAFLAYRRAGGENHSPGGQLAAAVAQVVTSGETNPVASQLAKLGARPDLPDYIQALVPVLQQIVVEPDSLETAVPRVTRLAPSPG